MDSNMIIFERTLSLSDPPVTCACKDTKIQGLHRRGRGTRGTHHPQYFNLFTLGLWTLHGKNRLQMVLVPPIVTPWRSSCQNITSPIWPMINVTYSPGLYTQINDTIRYLERNNSRTLIMRHQPIQYYNRGVTWPIVRIVRMHSSHFTISPTLLCRLTWNLPLGVCSM